MGGLRTFEHVHLKLRPKFLRLESACVDWAIHILLEETDLIPGFAACLLEFDIDALDVSLEVRHV